MYNKKLTALAILAAIAPTSRQVTNTDAAILRVRGGKIVEGSVLGDKRQPSFFALYGR